MTTTSYTYEQELAIFLELCGEVLDAADPKPTDNFFELGGDSISAVELSSLATMTLGRQIQILAIFEGESLGETLKVFAKPGRHG